MLPFGSTVLAQGITAGLIRERDAKRLKYLRSCLQVEVYYECEIYKMFKKIRICKSFSIHIMLWAPSIFAIVTLEDGLDRWSSTMKYNRDRRYHIKTSLHFILTLTLLRNPVGHPTAKLIPLNEQDVKWTRCEPQITPTKTYSKSSSYHHKTSKCPSYLCAAPYNFKRSP